MEHRIDCALITGREEFHRALAAALSFPEWYGHNLDALYDCLTDIAEPTHLILENWDSLSPALRGFRAVLDEAEEETPALIVTYLPR